MKYFKILFIPLFLLFAIGCSTMKNENNIKLSFSNKQNYQCGDNVVSVSYAKYQESNLAKLTINNTDNILSNVISGSGAKYAGEVYIWWEKGNTAAFTNLIKSNKSVQCNII